MLLGNIIKLKYCWAFPSLHLNPQLKQLLIQDADATIHSQMFFDAALWYFNSLLTASGNFLRPAKFTPILNGRKFLMALPSNADGVKFPFAFIRALPLSSGKLTHSIANK